MCQRDMKPQAIGTSPSRHFEIQITTELAIQRNADTIEIPTENIKTIPEKCQTLLSNVFNET